MKTNEAFALRITNGPAKGRYFAGIKNNRVQTAWSVAAGKKTLRSTGFDADIEALKKRGKKAEVICLTESVDSSILANLQELTAEDYQEIEQLIFNIGHRYFLLGNEICLKRGELKEALPALEKARRLKAFAEFCKQMRERGAA